MSAGVIGLDVENRQSGRGPRLRIGQSERFSASATRWGQVRGVGHAQAGRPMVEYIGDSILLDTGQMKVGELYGITYRQQPAVAVKRADGTVDFFGVPVKASQKK